MRLSLEYLKAEGARIPLGYGPAWRDYEREFIVCYPLGLHLIMRWARDLRHWFMEVGYPGHYDQVTMARYVKGYQRGFDNGREIGIQEGKLEAGRNTRTT